jgi:hypothetical protein
MPTQITGACGCGAVRFEITEAPQAVLYCHCTRCQRRTGTAAAVSARVRPGAVTVLSGQDDIRRWVPPDGMAKAFCGTCGSALWAETPDEGTIGAVRVGALDPGHDLRPTAHQFTAYAADWEALPDDGLPRHAERAPD